MLYRVCLDSTTLLGIKMDLLSLLVFIFIWTRKRLNFWSFYPPRPMQFRLSEAGTSWLRLSGWRMQIVTGGQTPACVQPPPGPTLGMSQGRPRPRKSPWSGPQPPLPDLGCTSSLWHIQVPLPEPPALAPEQLCTNWLDQSSHIIHRPCFMLLRKEPCYMLLRAKVEKPSNVWSVRSVSKREDPRHKSRMNKAVKNLFIFVRKSID